MVGVGPPAGGPAGSPGRPWLGPPGAGSGRRGRARAGSGGAGSGGAGSRRADYGGAGSGRARGDAAGVVRRGGWGGARGVPAACHSPSGPTTYSVVSNNHAPQSVAAGDRYTWRRSAFLGALDLIRRDFAEKGARNDTEITKQHRVRAGPAAVDRPSPSAAQLVPSSGCRTAVDRPSPPAAQLVPSSGCRRADNRRHHP